MLTYYQQKMAIMLQLCIEQVTRFFSYWYLRYLLVTELYMVEKWERHLFSKYNVMRDIYIQGLPSLNVGILPSCRGPQIKKNSVNFFCKFSNFFCNILEFF